VFTIAATILAATVTVLTVVGLVAAVALFGSLVVFGLQASGFLPAPGPLDGRRAAVSAIYVFGVVLLLQVSGALLFATAFSVA
jgi:hypothetical protein